MSTHMPGFQSFFRFLHHFVLAEVATTNIRVKFNMEDNVQSNFLKILLCYQDISICIRPGVQIR